jgi:hypothetical protein
MHSAAERSEHKPRPRNWSRTDKISAASLAVGTVLLVWALLLLYLQNATIGAMHKSLHQQQAEISSLQDQISSEDKKRTADTAAIMNMLATHNQPGNPSNSQPDTAANDALNKNPANPGGTDNSDNFNMMQPGTVPDQGTADSGAQSQ